MIFALKEKKRGALIIIEKTPFFETNSRRSSYYLTSRSTLFFKSIKSLHGKKKYDNIHVIFFLLTKCGLKKLNNIYYTNLIDSDWYDNYFGKYTDQWHFCAPNLLLRYYFDYLVVPSTYFSSTTLTPKTLVLGRISLCCYYIVLLHV